MKESFFEALIKAAGRHTRPDYKGSSFSYANDREMSQGTIRQPAIRNVIGSTGTTGSHERRQVIRAIHDRWRPKNPKMKIRFGDKEVDLTPGMPARQTSGAAGTITRNTHQKRNINLLNKAFMKSQGRIPRRMVIAHEGFHSRTPILGHSEIAAHAYGGWKANKGLKRLWNTHDRMIRPDGSPGSGTGAVNQLGHAIKTRPSRVLGEAAIAAGVGYGVYKGVKALKKWRDKKKEKEHERHLLSSSN